MTPEYSLIFTVLGVFIANSAMIIPLFLWNRSESRADIRKMESNLKSTEALVKAIHDEVRDFHLRLALQDMQFKMHCSHITEVK